MSEKDLADAIVALRRPTPKLRLTVEQLEQIRKAVAGGVLPMEDLRTWLDASREPTPIFDGLVNPP